MRTFMLVLVFMPSMFSWTRPVLHAKRIFDFLRESPISNDLVTDLAAHYFFKYLIFYVCLLLQTNAFYSFIDYSIYTLYIVCMLLG